VALLRASKALDNLKLNGDEGLGVTLIKKAVAMPLIQIAENAGLNGELIAAKLEEMMKKM
jgi:chaperonin GroEL